MTTLDLKNAPIFQLPYTSQPKTDPRCMKPDGCGAIVREACKCAALERVKAKQEAEQKGEA